MPFVEWFRHYPISFLKRDLISGVTVALVLIPQSMAYAQLAGLPAFYGLYAALLPPVIAALFGSSRQLATGPVAVVSLMTATALSPLASSGSEGFIAYAVLLAFNVGLFQFLLGVFKLGLVVNFLSHPVVNGFTNAAALIIASSQLANLFGVRAEPAEHYYEAVARTIGAAVSGTHLPTLTLGVLAFVIMAGVRKLNRRIPYVLIAVIVTSLIAWLTRFEARRDMPLETIADSEVRTEILAHNRSLEGIDSILVRKVGLSRTLKETCKQLGEHSEEAAKLNYEIALAELEINRLREAAANEQRWLGSLVFVFSPDGGSLIRTTAGHSGNGGRVWRLAGDSRRINPDAVVLVSGGAVVGNIPRGLPQLKSPQFNLEVMGDLFLMAVIISVLGFMEAISIAKAMAARTGQKLDPNQELIGQGLANIASSFTLGYPVSGSFSRSAVNLAAGAATGMSSVFSSVVVMMVLLFLTPLLYHLPLAALAAIIMMAVVGLLNIRGFVHAWQAQRFDGIIAVITFAATLLFAPHLDRGIMIGVALSLGVFLIRKIHPEVALLSRYWDGTFRNAERRGLRTCRHIAVIRFNDSLFFANVSFLESKIIEVKNSMPELRHIHIVGNAINELDASGEETLARILRQLRESGIGVTFSGLNENVLDVMKRTHLYEIVGDDRLFGNVALAVFNVYKKTHLNSDEQRCPLVEVQAVGLQIAPEFVAKLAAQDQALRQWGTDRSGGKMEPKGD